MNSMRALRTYRSCLLALACLAAVLVQSDTARSARFGRNKVQYRGFEWKVAQTEHFDVYFYGGSEDLADVVGKMSERANDEFERVLGHRLSTAIPVIVYASHNDFEQTNVSLTHVSETVGGFTELFKNRVVIPFTGSYEDLRHVIYHELTHVFMFDIVYGGLVESVVRQAYFNPVPLWFVEGLAEYVSQGWDSEAEMILRDLTVSNMVVPLQYLSGGYLIYKEGQSALNFIAERYGEEKIAEIVQEIARTQNLDRALRPTIGMTTTELSAEWEEWLERKYWPQVAGKLRGDETARLVTDHRRDHSYFNRSPTLSPDGNRLVFLSDRSGYVGVYLASALDGELLDQLVRGERTDEFETLHVLRPGFSWSPDGDTLCFVAKAGEADALHIVDAESGDVVRSLRFPLDGMFTPAWSPDGSSIAFVGTKYGASELYVTDPEGRDLVKLTDDYADERDPCWSPDGRRIAFAADRDSPPSPRFERAYDIYAIDVATGDVERLVASAGNESSPAWSPDGRTIVYVSDRGGTPDLYAATLDDSTSLRLTDLVGGAASPSWDGAGKRLAFALYGEGGWDIAVAKDPLTALRGEGAEPEIFASIEPAEHAEPPDPYAVTADRDAPAADVTGDAPPEPEESRAVRLARDSYRSARRHGRPPPEEDEERRPGSVEPYRPRFSPDWVDGGFSYSSAYGFGGSAQIVVSDVLGDHRFYLATDFFSTIDASNFHLQYEHLAHRINYAASVFRYTEYYYSERTMLGEDLGEKRYFTEDSYGMSVGAAYPFSKFSRVEFDLSAFKIDRTFAEETDSGEIELTEERVDRTLLVPSLRLVNDTTLWGSVGPVSGGRSSFVVAKASEIGSGGFRYLTVAADFRRYLRIGARHSLALKLVGARSTQADAQNFYIGGVNSLRGYDDFKFGGTRMALASVEFRYPFIDRLEIASPIPLSIWGVRGILFADLGATWDDAFRGVRRDDEGVRFEDIKSSYGFGVRANLGFFVVRVDRAWPYDLQTAGDPRTHFALGAEF